MLSVRNFIILSGLGGFISVAFGAFGAHFLKTRLDEYYLSVFKTGVEYQFFHSLALGFVALTLERWQSPLLRFSGAFFIVGMVIFSGSLYLLAMTKIKMWGAVTPLGGLCFLVGWALFVVAAVKQS